MGAVSHHHPKTTTYYAASPEECAKKLEEVGHYINAAIAIEEEKAEKKRKVKEQFREIRERGISRMLCVRPDELTKDQREHLWVQCDPRSNKTDSTQDDGMVIPEDKFIEEMLIPQFNSHRERTKCDFSACRYDLLDVSNVIESAKINGIRQIILPRPPTDEEYSVFQETNIYLAKEKGEVLSISPWPGTNRIARRKVARTEGEIEGEVVRTIPRASISTETSEKGSLGTKTESASKLKSVTKNLFNKLFS